MTASRSTQPAAIATASNDQVLLVISAYAGLFILFGLLVSGPIEAVHGLGSILVVRDTLITDYIGVGGIGGAFLNTGLLTLISVLIYRWSGAKIGGAAIACLFLVLGFGLFGKNLLNIWFIVLGVFLYAKFKGEAFAAHINTAFFGAALSPIFSEIVFGSTLPVSVSLPLGAATMLVIGFALVPAAAQLFKAHMGFSLYNMGFTAGVVGAIVVAIYKSYGFLPDPVFVWSTGNNWLLGAFLYAIFTSMIALGLWFDRTAFSGVVAIMRLSGQSPSDFTEKAGFGAALVNMALTGAIGTSYVLLVGGDLNGPTIGAVFTIVGFSAYGKHPRNIVPIMAGVVLGSIFKPWNIADPTIVLAALFGTTLAPIAGRFGWHWGIVAGFVHSSVAQSVGVLYGGLNLYNNGFAAGLVASVLVPIILALRKPEEGKEEPER
ncbi:DUF1576 domain-containing protein [Kaistia dalseonensis]|uniref:DUF1576 domain-containing protein n=1 Tax=Kaistia dalseonensis TaxID=410840 RepID=A0ABU0H115_9HYPH|nr:DUF1576 domain-containing protein [Kaistia dalseonensis]MCX5493439.1 DUF1576 domain-containing protein [Kaistia dalseonensis]MDQ0435998.1 hypothetical protein [Kaistia dalseonensis]